MRSFLRARGRPQFPTTENTHETHLSTLQDAPRTHARLSRAHENPWRAQSHQRAPCQGAQAPCRLSAAARTLLMQRLRCRSQFERLLATPVVVRTSHFALHHRAGKAGVLCVGVITPKRWARRAVTRNAIRRQIYATGAAQRALPAGMYLVRQRAMFAPAHFPSASSPALRRAVREELLALWLRAAAHLGSAAP